MAAKHWESDEWSQWNPEGHTPDFGYFSEPELMQMLEHRIRQIKAWEEQNAVNRGAIIETKNEVIAIRAAIQALQRSQH